MLTAGTAASRAASRPHAEELINHVEGHALTDIARLVEV